MKSAVLLINLPSESVREPEEHCGLAILDAFLKSNNVSCEILDSYALNFSLQETKNKIKYWIDTHIDYRCIVGFSPFVTSHNSFVQIGKELKRKFCNVEIIAGGHYASLNKERLLNEQDWIDAIIVGEGEFSLLEYVQLDNKRVIRGVYTRENAFTHRERIMELDSLPYQSRYLTKSQLNGQPFSLYTSRGCYGNCSFCSISSFYETNTMSIKQTYRSAKSVSNEIKHLVSEYGIQSLKIIDDNFFRNNSNNFLRELIEELKDINISFRLSARPNDVTEERGLLLKALHVRVLAIGVESTHDESLSLFNKGIKIDDSLNAIHILKNNNITCLANFIMFTPIIDLENLMRNVNFIESNINNCIFHRINSHLWVRATDPIVEKLVDLKLSENEGFPYVQYEYKFKIIKQIKAIFDIWCDSTMNSYYDNVDALMALGIEHDRKKYNNYKRILMKDIEILRTLIEIAKKNDIKGNGEKYIFEQIKNW